MKLVTAASLHSVGAILKNTDCNLKRDSCYYMWKDKIYSFFLFFLIVHSDLYNNKNNE